MTARCIQVGGLADISEQLGYLHARSVIVDVEPLVAYWNTGDEELSDGLTATVDHITENTHIQHIVFSTNSARSPVTNPASHGVEIRYLTSAAKPLSVAPYRDLPRPGVVVGDQVVTDGLLARRLDYTFLHYTPHLPRTPLGPWVMKQIGRPVRIGFFRSQ